jgi:outer membrane protein W
MPIFRLILIPVLAAACCMAAFAQSSSPGHREFEVTGFVGRSVVPDLDFPTKVIDGDQVTLRTVGLRYNRGYHVGVRVAQHFEDYWAANLEYSVSHQRVRFLNLSPGVENISLSHLIHQFSYSISLAPTRLHQRFRPYVMLGAGSTLFYIPDSSKHDASLFGLRLRDSWEFTVNAGGGFKFLMADRAVFTVDLKDHISGVPSYGLPLSAEVTAAGFQPGIETRGMLHNWRLNAGLGFQWNGW